MSESRGQGTTVRTWLGYVFERVAEIDPDRDPDGRVSRFAPAERYAQAATARRHRYGAGPFCRFALRGLGDASGVYVVTTDGHHVYVGECANLAQRWGLSQYGSIQPRNCYVRGQQTNCMVNNLILGAVEAGERVDLWFTTSDRRKETQDELIAALRPPWNRAR